MREAKIGAWYNEYPWRGLANNSVAYTETPDMEVFMEEWLSLVKSKSGERGIFNRVASQKQAEKQGRDPNLSYGTNPCSEIILRPTGQMCNLTECVVRANDTHSHLLEKVRLATILGTFQSTLTKFQFLSAEWLKNTEEERLLGVSLTGIMDNKFMANPDPKFLEELRDEARRRTKNTPSFLTFRSLLLLLVLSQVVLLVSLLTPLVVFIVDIVIIIFVLLELIRRMLFMSSLKGRGSL
jgi:ribonucleoside-diphosphate reductase alpha chain